MITIQIHEASNGGVITSAWENGGKVDSAALMRAIGMLELARAALIAGRWGLRDSMDATTGIQYPNVMQEEYDRRRADINGESPK